MGLRLHARQCRLFWPWALTVACSLPPLTSFATEQPAATVVLMKGDVLKLLPGAKSPVGVKQGDRLTEGTLVSTKERSFAKLLFSDNSQMNVGPASQMKIEQYRKDQPGLIKLIDGSIRAKITKELVGPKTNEPKDKLLLRTKTAALGVRGTDFQVTYSDSNGATSLVTFESEVALAKFDGNQGGSPAEIQAKMSEVLRSDTAVLVGEGQFSAASRTQENPSPAVKISPEQLESLKRNESMLPAAAGGEASAKPANNYISPIPPGVDAKKFAGAADVSKVLEKTLGKAAAAEVVTKAAQVATAAAPASESKSAKAQEAPGAPLAGGYVDLSKGVYVAPDPKAGAIFDPVTKMFTPDPSVKVGGGGDLQLAKGVSITDSGEIRRVDPNTGAPAPLPGTFDGTRTIASAEPVLRPPPELDQNRIEERDEETRLNDQPPPSNATDSVVIFNITTS